jgi:hypothetical protein
MTQQEVGQNRLIAYGTMVCSCVTDSLGYSKAPSRPRNYFCDVLLFGAPYLNDVSLEVMLIFNEGRLQRKTSNKLHGYVIDSLDI